MKVEAQVSIAGSAAAVWDAIADVANAAEVVSGIEAIEVVEQPKKGLVGLRWRETRILFGKPATVEKWITDATEGQSYTTRAEDGGFVFLATLRLAEGAGGVTLTSVHESRPQTFVARWLKLPMVFLFKGTVRKALRKDLDDIKAAVEREGPIAA